MPIRKNSQINLLPQDEFQSSSLGRILKWALSTFRIMVIVTELIVMGAFLSRFWLDARNSDLNEELEIGKAQVEAYASIEADFRLKQKQISIAKTLYTETKSSEVVKNISKYIPTDVTLDSILIKDGQLTVKATSKVENSASQFISNLETYDKIENVSLSQISSSPEDKTLIIFTIIAKMKGQPLAESK